MTRLQDFREHCRRMATAQHKPECPSLEANRPHWPDWRSVCDDAGQIVALRWSGLPPPLPKCDGCLTDEDRALFAQLATEAEDYVQGRLV